MDHVAIGDKMWEIISELRDIPLDEVQETEDDSIASLFGGIEGYNDGFDEHQLMKFASAISNVFWEQKTFEQQFDEWMASLTCTEKGYRNISQEEVRERFGMHRVQWVGAVTRFFTEEVTTPCDLSVWLGNALHSEREPPWHPVQWECDQQRAEQFYAAIEGSGCTIADDLGEIEQRGVGWKAAWTCPKGWVVVKTPSSPLPVAAWPELREGFFTNVLFVVESFDGSIDNYIKVNAQNAVKMGLWAEYSIVDTKKVDLSRIGLAAERIFVAEGFGPQGHHLQAISYCWELGSLKAVMTCTALLDSDWDLLRVKLVDTLRTLHLTADDRQNAETTTEDATDSATTDQSAQFFQAALESNGYTITDDPGEMEQRGVGWKAAWMRPKGWVVVKTPASPIPLAALPELREGFFTNICFTVESFDGSLDKYIKTTALNVVKMGLWADYRIVSTKSVEVGSIARTLEKVVAEGFGPQGNHLRAVSFSWELGSLKAMMTCTALMDSDWNYLQEQLIETLCTLHMTADKQQNVDAKSGCFIATACYGSVQCSEVTTLREYRDQVLLMSGIGRSFVRTYYALSPWIAKRLSTMPGTRTFVREHVLSHLVCYVVARKKRHEYMNKEDEDTGATSV